MKRFFAELGYRFWIILGVVLAVVIFLSKALFTKGSGKASDTLLPPLPDIIVKQTERAQEKALVARAEAKAKSRQQKEVLQEITAEPEGPERRKRLAYFLENL